MIRIAWIANRLGTLKKYRPGRASRNIAEEGWSVLRSSSDANALDDGASRITDGADVHAEDIRPVPASR